MGTFWAHISAFSRIEDTIVTMSKSLVAVASVMLVLLLLITTQTIRQKKNKHLKKPLFILICAIIIAPTLYISGASAVLNTVSDSKGPVSRNSGIEFWVCGEEIELRNPSAPLERKIGASSFFEQDDKMIQLEGIIVDETEDATLGKFMDSVGGSISSSRIIIPTELSLFENNTDGDPVSGQTQWAQEYARLDTTGKMVIDVANGNRCNNTLSAQVQAFSFNYDVKTKTYSQMKMTDPATFVIQNESTSEPGSCIIVEYDAIKDRTDKLCQAFGERDGQRCGEFGATPVDTSNCPIKDPSAPVADEEAPVYVIPISDFKVVE